MHLTNICINVTKLHTYTDTEKLHKVPYVRKTLCPGQSWPSKSAPCSSFLCPAPSTLTVPRFPPSSTSLTLAWGLPTRGAPFPPATRSSFLITLNTPPSTFMHVYKPRLAQGKHTSNIKLWVIFISWPMYTPGCQHVPLQTPLTSFLSTGSLNEATLSSACHRAIRCCYPVTISHQSLCVLNGLFNAVALWFPQKKKLVLNISY